MNTDNININNTDNSKLFFKVFRNKFLKSQIIYHIHIYNKYSTIEINSFKELSLINNFQYKSYISKIKYNSNEPIYTTGLIPCNVTTIQFGDDFNQSLAPINSIPDNVKTIIFGRSFNQPLRPIKECIAQSMIELNIDKYFTKIINLDGGMVIEQQQQQPQRKNKLFGRSFKPAGCLPGSVQHIVFGANYNLPLEKDAIPSSCISIQFGDDFNNGNYSLEPGVFPDSIKEITFGLSFSQNILPNTIPSSTKVNFGKYYNKTRFS